MIFFVVAKIIKKTDKEDNRAIENDTIRDFVTSNKQFATIYAA